MVSLNGSLHENVDSQRLSCLQKRIPDMNCQICLQRIISNQDKTQSSTIKRSVIRGCK